MPVLRPGLQKTRIRFRVPRNPVAALRTSLGEPPGGAETTRDGGETFQRRPLWPNQLPRDLVSDLGCVSRAKTRRVLKPKR